MTTYYHRAGPFRVHFDRDGVAAATLYLGDADQHGLRLNTVDMQSLLSRVRLLEVGYDRWGNMVALSRGAIIFDQGRTRYRAQGKYQWSNTTIGELIGMADAVAGYLDARRARCKWCGEAIEPDLGARAYHPKCRKRKKNHDYYERVTRPRVAALKATN